MAVSTMGRDAWLPLTLILLWPACSAPAPTDVGPGSAPAARAPKPPSAESIDHQLSFRTTSSEIDVRSVFPVVDGELELMMAVWTPGSYLVREHARNVEAVKAQTLAGEPLSIRKTRKNRWQIEAAGESRVVVGYRLYAHEATVRTNYVDDELASIVGAATFMVPVDRLDLPTDLALQLPSGWTRSVTSLAAHPSGEPHRYRAGSFDELIDAPIVAGTGEVRSFEVDGIIHRAAYFGGQRLWDVDRATADVERVAQAHRDLWGQVPYPRYTFVHVLLDDEGGLEHGESALLMVSRWAQREPSRQQDWLGLVSHELFHAWNVKRLRPNELATIDYEREVYTRALWIVEGLSSYYDDLLVRRAGLIDDETYLDRISKAIAEVERAPGRHVQSLADASFDAWIKQYRPDEHSVNAGVSYYTKGALVGLLLDAAIRERTGGARSLDDVFRAAYERFASKTYAEKEFRALCAEMAGAPLDEFFARYVDGKAELDFAPALALYGLGFEAPRPVSAAQGWIGATTGRAEGQILVEEVLRGSPAEHAGLRVGDEILALDGYRVGPADFASRITRFRPGETVELLVSRKRRLVRSELTLERKPSPRGRLRPIARPTAAQKARLREWLSGVRS